MRRLRLRLACLLGWHSYAWCPVAPAVVLGESAPDGASAWVRACQRCGSHS